MNSTPSLMEKTITVQKPAFTDKKFLPTLVFVTSLFMLWGIAITMGDVLNKHFQTVLNLTKTAISLCAVCHFWGLFCDERSGRFIYETLWV